MKRLFAFLLVLCLTFCVLSACSNPTEGNPGTGDTGGDDKTGKEDPPSVTPPYDFVFVSNGDGTCYIDGMTANLPTSQGDALCFPERSPSGDLVTEIRKTELHVAIPQIVDAQVWETQVIDVFDARLDALAEAFGEDSEEYQNAYDAYMTIDTWYRLITKADLTHFNDLQDFLSENGGAELLENGNAYILDTFSAQSITEAERGRLYDLFNKYIGYTREETVISATERALAAAKPDSVWAKNVRAMDSLIDPLKFTSITVPATVTQVNSDTLAACTHVTHASVPVCALSELKSHELASVTVTAGTELPSFIFGSMEKLTELALPASIVCIQENAFWSCSRLSQIRFDGTMEAWQSVEKHLDWKSTHQSLTVICTDGEITE